MCKRFYNLQLSILLEDCFENSSPVEVRKELMLNYKDLFNDKYKDKIVGVNVDGLIQLMAKEIQ